MTLSKLVILISFVFLLLGCGGNGGGLTTNLNEGNYAGTWANADSQISGTLTLSINAQGVTTGTFYHTQLDEEGTVAGTVDSLGLYSLTATLPSGTLQGTGLVSQDENLNLYGDPTSGFSFTVARQ